jgi:sulfate adenylyltransferase subunit 1
VEKNKEIKKNEEVKKNIEGQVSRMDIMKIVVAGHVDHGKSTVIGRLLYDTHSLPEGTVNKAKRIAKETGKPFEYAYLLDAFEEEQKQGITIDTTQIQFRTTQRDYVIIDAPGHKEFLKNMISGAADAEAAFLIIDGKEGVQEQSRRHAYLLSLIGIKKIYVIINKMDLVDYSQEVFETVKKEMKEFLRSLQIDPIDYIPVCAYYGENILKNSENLSWFTGVSVIEAMDAIEKEKGLEEQPLRFPIQDVYKFDHRRIIAGRIERGKLRVGDSVVIYPEGRETTIKSIEVWQNRDKKEEIKAGESVGVCFEHEFFNKRGEIIALKESSPLVSRAMRANIFWMGKNDLILGKKYKIKLATQEVIGEVTEIIKVIDASSLDSSKSVDRIVQNDVAEVIINMKEPLVFDNFITSSATGRFVIVDGYDVAGGGIIVEKAKVDLRGRETFIYKDLKARGDIFEEFYYNIEEFSINKMLSGGKAYTVGDKISLKGQSYEYPENLDILVLRDNTAILVRYGKIKDIVSVDKYEPIGYPLVNGRGFSIMAKSKEEVIEFLKEYRELNEENAVVFYRRWLKFETYRKVVFLNKY